MKLQYQQKSFEGNWDYKDKVSSLKQTAKDCLQLLTNYERNKFYILTKLL